MKFVIYEVTGVNAGAKTVTLAVGGTARTVRYPSSVGTPSIGDRAWCVVEQRIIRPLAFDA